MKKSFLAICMLAMSIAANAQLKVQTTGKVVIADTTATSPSAALTVGPAPSVSGKVGVNAATSGTSHVNTAIYGSAMNNGGMQIQQNAVNCGVRGFAGSNQTNIGVQGAISASSYGAGVYGSTSTTNGVGILGGRYAGYFNGDLFVKMAITGNLSNKYDSKTSFLTTINNILDYLDDISVKKYNANPGPGPINSLNLLEEFPELEDGYDHYMMEVSSVANVFPSLVKTNGQGGQYVNYTELIPLLLKAIQELKAQVDVLSGSSGAAMMSPAQGSTTAVNEPLTLGKSTTARLLQNTPNPFTERTEIRFSVPDDTRSAYIYIFDMTGKMLRQIPVNSTMQSVTINGYELSAGIYLYSLVINGQVIDTKRMILSK